MRTTFKTLWKIINDDTLDIPQTLKKVIDALMNMEKELKEIDVNLEPIPYNRIAITVIEEILGE